MAKKASPIQLSHNLAWESNPDGTSARVVLDVPDLPAEVDRRLNLFEPGDTPDSDYEQRLLDGIDTIGAIWDFCFENGKGQFMDVKTPWHLQIVLRRFVVLTLMFRAKRLADHNLRSICKLLPHPDLLKDFLPLSRVPVSKIGLEAVERFNARSRVQKPASSIKNYQEAAKRGHKTRKANAARKQEACQAKSKGKNSKTVKQCVARKPSAKTAPTVKKRKR